MSANLFFLSDGKAQSMSESRYEREDNLQQIIADNPRLLQRDSDKERKHLYLVGREFLVHENNESSSGYSLDHLFLDRSGIPVLVEVKRSSDTRIRREVVAQMIDYASRARIWDISELRDAFRKNNDEDILSEIDTDDFWQRVMTNLKAERLCLVFAADTIPGPLRTLIEFLDRSMTSIEVYGVEIKQYKAGDTIMLTSNIIEGVPAKEKNVVKTASWDMDSLTSFLIEGGRGEVVPVAKDLKQFLSDLGLSTYFGHGFKFPRFSVFSGEDKLFNVGPWQYSDGLKCTIEIKIPTILELMPEDWTETKLRNMLSNLPNKESCYAKRLIWKSEQYLFMDLAALLQPEDMAAFKESLKVILNLI